MSTGLWTSRLSPESPAKATAKNVDIMPLVPDGPDAAVYLFSPSGGVEAFATLDAIPST